MTKVLIVSNDEQFSKMLSYTLNFNGFTVEASYDVPDAWKKLEQIHFDLLLIDQSLKGTTGVDFCQEIRNNASQASLIVIGERHDELTLMHGTFSGVDDYVLRPFGMEELKLTVNKQLERKRCLNKRSVSLADKIRSSFFTDNEKSSTLNLFR